MAILHFETVPKKPTSEFIVSCLLGSFAPWEKGQPLPKCKSSCWRVDIYPLYPTGSKRSLSEDTTPPQVTQAFLDKMQGPRRI